ncbi:MAG: PD40 domain-containing protein, partial [Planctomycetes bacterium]|nr:PD40 domain-containing protein [Planctomycetota bacterium]
MHTTPLSCVLLAAAVTSFLPAQTTELVSRSPGGTAANNGCNEPVVSGDGRFVAFVSSATNLVSGDTNNRLDVFVRDLHAATTTRVSIGPGGVEANHDCIQPVISADGRFVAFASAATNLVAGGTNNFRKVYLHDRLTGTTSLACLTS